MKAHSCPRCKAPLPRTRKPTSWRQMMWGGWTCASCGAELNARRQLIDGRLDTPGSIVIALKPTDQRQNRILMLGLVAALPLAGLLLMLQLVLGEWVLLLGGAVLGVLMVLALIGAVRELRGAGARSVRLTDAAIRWGDEQVRPDTITAVRLEGQTVCIEAGGQQHRLQPLGDAAPLLSAIQEVRQVARDTGTAADVPDSIQRARQPTGGC